MAPEEFSSACILGESSVAVATKRLPHRVPAENRIAVASVHRLIRSVHRMQLAADSSQHAPRAVARPVDFRTRTPRIERPPTTNHQPPTTNHRRRLFDRRLLNWKLSRSGFLTWSVRATCRNLSDTVRSRRLHRPAPRTVCRGSFLLRRVPIRRCENRSACR